MNVYPLPVMLPHFKQFLYASLNIIKTITEKERNFWCYNTFHQVLVYIKNLTVNKDPKNTMAPILL
uniref:Uncharacterized protein n=1 Tax=Anguilla anguilla TaxID=7936 RepID=A0A0E9R2U6_ANGAN